LPSGEAEERPFFPAPPRSRSLTDGLVFSSKTLSPLFSSLCVDREGASVSVSSSRGSPSSDYPSASQFPPREVADYRLPLELFQFPAEGELSASFSWLTHIGPRTAAKRSGVLRSRGTFALPLPSEPEPLCMRFYPSGVSAGEIFHRRTSPPLTGAPFQPGLIGTFSDRFQKMTPSRSESALVPDRTFSGV